MCLEATAAPRHHCADDARTRGLALLKFHFDAEQGSGWQGERLSYEVPAAATIDRTLMVAPQAHLGFIEVSAIANRIDAKMIDRIDVALRFEDPSGWVAEKLITLRAGGEPQPWKVRTSSPDARQYSYVLTHHLTGGNAPIIDPPVVSSANAVAVDDPFPDALEIDLVPNWDPAVVRTVFVDVTYVDGPNQIERLDHFEFKGDDLDARRLRIALRNRKARSFGWRATYMRHDRGKVQRGGGDVTDTLVELSM